MKKFDLEKEIFDLVKYDKPNYKPGSDDIIPLIDRVVTAITPEKKEGFDTDPDVMRCKECGDYDDCTCDGFNQAISEIEDNWKEIKG